MKTEKEIKENIEETLETLIFDDNDYRELYGIRKWIQALKWVLE